MNCEVKVRKRGLPLTPALARLRVEKRTRQDGECLVWTGNIDVHGYPRLNLGGQLFLVHRLVRALADGASYAGLHVHHKCRRKACVRLEHLEVLTPSAHTTEHMAGKMVCSRGHSLADAYDRPDGHGRQCRQCITIRARRQWGRLKAEAAAVRELLPPRACLQCQKPFARDKKGLRRYCSRHCQELMFFSRHPGYAKHGRPKGLPS